MCDVPKSNREFSNIEINARANCEMHREGLEKMERGKQKEADRMREAKERDEKQRQIRLAESTVISLNPGGAANTIEPAAAQLLLKSKFVCIIFDSI